MRQAYKLGILLLIVSSTALSGCYTRVVSDGGGYYGYGHRVYHVRSVRSDTITSAEAEPKTEMRYDTTMKGDTMYIEEKPVATSGGGSLSADNETIVNNYYDDNDAWPYYWPPSPAFAISFGWPCNTWYNPWWGPSYYSWDYWGYPGFYPPVYDPYFAFYGPGFGYGNYGHRFYDHGYHGGFGHRYAFGGEGRYPYSSAGRSATGTGRGASGIGEGRSITLGPTRSGTPNSIGMQNSRGLASSIGTRPQFSSSTGRTGVAVNRLSEVSGDRNSPVHAVSPDGTTAMARGGEVNSASTSSNYTRPVVVRRGANGTTTTTMANGRQYVVVRRGGGAAASSSGLSSRSYGPAGRSYGYPSSGARSSGGSRGSSGNSSGGVRSSGGSSSGGSGGRGSGGGSSSSGGGGGRGGR